MRYPQSKTENGALGKIPDGHDQYVGRIKKYFLIFLVMGIIFLIIGISNLGGYARDLYSSGRSGLFSLAYILEYSTKNENNILINNDGPAGSVTVLVYHGLLNEYDNSGINTTVKNFKDQMFSLKNAGYETISTEELLKFLRGEAELPKRSVMITFDDGRFDSYYNADPILRALGFKAVMFVISNYSLGSEQSSYYIGTEDIKRMAESGRWDIQPHTNDGHELYPIDQYGHTAPFFANTWWLPESGRNENDEEFKNRITGDMDTVKDSLEKVLNKEMIALAFPYGDYGQGSANTDPKKDIVLEEGGKRFNLLFHQYSPTVRFESNYFIEKDKTKNYFLLKRSVVEPSWNGEKLLSSLEASRAKDLPFIETFEKDSGWIKSWGTLTINSSLNDQNRYSEMVLSTEGPEHAGAAVILDGSRLWKDYILKTKLLVPNQNSAFAWVRFQNDENNAGCNMGNGFIHIEQVINGQHRVLKGVRGPEIIIPQEEFAFDVKVQGRKISCIVNGNTLVETDFLDLSLDRGGIGFKTWDNIPGMGLLVIKSIKVEPI